MNGTTITVLDLQKGVTLKKGSRKRTFLGLEYDAELRGWFVLYSVPSDRNHRRLEPISCFNDWMEKAIIL